METLLQRVHDQLANAYRDANRAELFRLIEPHLSSVKGGLSRAEIGQHLDFSPAAVAMSIDRVRRRFGELLMNEVARTVDNPEDVEDELHRLRSIVRGNG